MTPGEGDWRVVIIDAADEMNGNAANAVLKSFGRATQAGPYSVDCTQSGPSAPDGAISLPSFGAPALQDPNYYGPPDALCA